MKIAPNNKISKKNLNFRLWLSVELHQGYESLTIFKGVEKQGFIDIIDRKEKDESGLDMDFEIERKDDGNPNICTLTIWNLSEDIFNQIALDANLFSLYYARGENDWSLLFTGSPYFAKQENPIGGNNDARGFLKRDDAVGGENDIPTIIYLEEAKDQYEKAVMSKSYKGDVSTEVVLKDCANALGMPLNVSKEIAHSKVSNFVARGYVYDVLKEIRPRLTIPFGIGDPKITFENSNLNVFAEIEDVGLVQLKGAEIERFGYVFNPKNSSKPVRVQSDSEELYSFETQLLPSIKVGDFCACDFSNLQGRKQIRKIISTGNNYGTEGKTEVTVSV